MLETFEAGPYSHIVLEPQYEGVYVLVYDEAGVLKFDYLQDDFPTAKLFCRIEYGTTDESWQEYHGPPVMN